MKQNIQQQAQWLGYAGVIPFIAAGLLVTDLPQELVIKAIHSYAAIILTFIGAIHWGRSLWDESVTNKSLLPGISVLPSLVAWLSFFLPATYALSLLVVSFALLLLFDFRQYASIPWFRKLRLNLTLMVCTSLIFCLVIISSF